MSAQADEDAIDLQDIQAQIDLSMSFAQNLVTSWVKPIHFSQSTRRRDIENELKEYMRRPARLGVGAPVPETQSLARDAARLKSKLEGGKKRKQREEEEGGKATSSGDEEESRAMAIKQKVRRNPFDAALKKKGKGAELSKKNMNMDPAAVVPQVQDRAEDKSDINEVEEQLLDGAESPATFKPKKKQKFNSDDDVQQRQLLSPTLSSLTQARPALNGEGSSCHVPASPKHPKPFKPLSSSLRSPIRSSHTSPAAIGLKVVDVSLTSTPSQSPGHRTTNPDFLKQPLLNLDGSPGGAEINQEDQPGLNGSPKKKRRRRKKQKRAQQNTAALNEG